MMSLNGWATHANAIDGPEIETIQCFTWPLKKSAVAGREIVSFNQISIIQAESPYGSMQGNHKVITIEGGIGVGKSTVLRGLAQQMGPGVHFIDEPVAKWQESGMLQAMYDNQLPSGVFQQMALMTRAASILKALRLPGVHTIITERSPFSDLHVFAKTTLSGLTLQAYELTYEELMSTLPGIDLHVILLDAPIEVLLQRIESRSRVAEKNIGKKYLEHLADAHSRFFAEVNAVSRHRVNAVDSPSQILENVYTIIRACVEDAKKP